MSADREVIQAAADWARAGKTVALVTVARTWGASPRPLGSLMAMTTSGETEGSVSGGCVEADLLAHFVAGALDLTLPVVLSYGIKQGDAQRMGLPCGGRLELVVEGITESSGLDALLARIDGGALLTRTVSLADGSVALVERGVDGERKEQDGLSSGGDGTLLSTDSALPSGGDTPLSLTNGAWPSTDSSLSGIVTGATFHYDGATLHKVFGPLWHMLLIGAGHLARELTRMARLLDFQVTVCDPRPELAQWPVAGAGRTTAMPDEAVARLAAHPRLVVLGLSHDLKLDDLGIYAALQSPAFYVGAIGSQRTSGLRRARLAELGLDEQALSRLRSPVGLAIGSRTPAEIAVAILADVIARRNGMVLSPISSS